MPRREDWVEMREAAEILSKRAGRTIDYGYVRVLAHKTHAVRMKKKEGYVARNLYYRPDLETYEFRKKRAEKEDVREEDEPKKNAAKTA